MRERCGCAVLDELDADPGLAPDVRAAQTALGRSLQEQWGCTAVGLTPPERLSRGQAEDLDDWCRATRLPRPRTCPLACTRRSSPWLVEITRVVRVLERTKGGITFRQLTGRAPHLWDVRAIDALLEVADAVSASDDKVREREREARDAEMEAKRKGG